MGRDPPERPAVHHEERQYAEKQRDRRGQRDLNLADPAQHGGQPPGIAHLPLHSLSLLGRPPLPVARNTGLLSQESSIATHYARLVTARTQHVPCWIPTDLDAHAGQVAANRQDGTLDRARLSADHNPDQNKLRFQISFDHHGA